MSGRVFRGGVNPEPVPLTAAPGTGGSVRGGTVKIAVATVLFGAAHSLLAGTPAKALAAEWLGPRTADAFYRVAYNAITLTVLGALVWYVRRQPGRELYHARGLPAWLMRAGQAAALGYGVWGVAHVGLDFLVGWDHLVAWWQGADVPRMPDGQGPRPAGDAMLATGPFAHTRHPLNWFLVPLLWLNPRMTTRLLAFNLVVTAYAVVGSVHLETHLLDAYGEAYRAYRERVPFFFGRW